MTKGWMSLPIYGLGARDGVPIKVRKRAWNAILLSTHLPTATTYFAPPYFLASSQQIRRSGHHEYVLINLSAFQRGAGSQAYLLLPTIFISGSDGRRKHRDDKTREICMDVYCLLSCTACYPQALAALTLLATITLLSIERFLFQLVLELGEVGSARAGWMCG